MPTKKILLWTAEHQADARLEGWELADSIDSGTSKPRLRIFATASKHTNQGALLYVLEQAKQHSALHLTALRAVAANTTEAVAKEKK